MLDSYLIELKQELSLQFDASEVALRLAEVEAHLQEGVAGRIELGMTSEEATAEALAAFGGAIELGHAMRSRPSVISRAASLGTGYGVAMLFFIVLFPILEWRWGFELFLVAWLALGGAFVVASFRSRRPAPLQILGTGVLGALGVWLACGMTWLSLETFGGGGVVPPGKAESQMDELRRTLAWKKADLQTLNTSLKALRGPFGIEAMRTPGGYLAPKTPASWGYDHRLALTTVEDARQAKDAWRDADRRARSAFETDRIAANLAAIPRAQADPIGNLLASAPSILPPCVGVAIFATVVDLTFGTLGFYAFALRRRRAILD